MEPSSNKSYDNLSVSELSEYEKDRILNLSQDLICIAGMDGYFKYLNSTWETLLGYTQSELLSKPFISFIHPEDHLKNDDEVAHMMKGENTVHFENRYICKDGSIKHISWKATPLVEEKKMYCIGRDVTHDKQNEIALKQSEARYRTISENANEGILVMQDNERKYYNKQWQQMTGYPEDKYDTVPFFGLVYEEDLVLCQQMYDNFISGHLGENELVLRIKHYSGELRWLNAKLSQIVWEGRTAVLVLLEDITSKTHLQAELSKSRENLKALIENTEGSIWSVDREYRLIVGNSSFDKNIRQWRGKIFEPGDPVLVDDQSEYMMEWQTYYDRVFSGEAFIIEKERLFVDQSQIFEYHFHPIYDQGGTVTGAAVYGRDVTHEKELYRALRMSEYQHRMLLKYAGAGIGYYDADGKLLMINDLAVQNMGGVSEDYVGKSLIELFGEHDGRRYLSRVQEVITNNCTLEFVDKVELATGTKWFSSTYTAIETLNNEIDGVLIVSHDISDIKQAELTIKERGERYRALFEQMPSGVAVYQIDGDDIFFKDFNRTAEMIDNLDRNMIIGKKLDDIFPGVNEIGFVDVIKRVYQTGKSEFLPEFIYQDSQRSEVWRENWIYKLPSGDVVAVYNDITKRKEDEGVLQKFKDMMEEAQAVAQIGSWEYDVINDKTTWSKEMFRIFGRDLEEGEPIWLEHKYYIHPDDWDQLNQAVNAAIQTGIPYSEDYRIVKTNGEITYGHSMGRARRDEKGNIIRLVGTTQNITYRKLNEKKLAESEERYRTLAENTEDIICRYDDRCRHLFVNSAVKKLMKVASDKYLGRTHRQLGFPPEKCDLWEAMIDKVFKTGQSIRHECEFDGENGPIVFDWMFSPEFNAEGQVVSVLSNIRDISEQKQAHFTIEQSEKKYRLLFENMLNGFALHEIVVDKNGKAVDYIFLEANAAFELQTGLKRKNIINKKVIDVIPGIGNDPADWIGKYGEVALRNKEIRFEAFSEPLDKYYSILAFSPQYGQFATVFEDITQRKMAETELRKSEKRYRELFEQSNDAIFIYNDKGVIQDVNQRACQLLELTEEQLIRKKKSMLHPSSERKYVAQRLKEVILNGYARYESIFVTGKGKEIQVDISSRIVNYIDNIIQAVVRDITDIKKTENELIQHRKELQKLSVQLIHAQEEERLRLSQELHDELGQALTALNIDLSKVERLISDNAQAQAVIIGMRSIIKMIDKQLKRIQSELRPGMLDDLGLVAAMEWQLQDFKNRTSIKCEFNKEIDDSKIGTEMSTTLYRVLQEGLTNIMKHAGASLVTVKITGKENKIILKIRDNGRGIRESEKSKKKSLGLLGMRERIAYLDGTLNIKGKPDEGTVLTIKLPWVSENVQN